MGSEAKGWDTTTVSSTGSMSHLGALKAHPPQTTSDNPHPKVGTGVLYQLAITKPNERLTVPVGTCKAVDKIAAEVAERNRAFKQRGWKQYNAIAKPC